MRVLIITCFTLIITAFINCSSPQETFNVYGAWYLIRQDSVYEENIFSENFVWTYDENAGEMKYKYRIDKDSLKFISPDGVVSMAYRINIVNNDEFTLKGTLFDLHYHRLSINIDTSKLIIGDVQIIDEYILGLRERRYNWMNRKK